MSRASYRPKIIPSTTVEQDRCQLKLLTITPNPAVDRTLQVHELRQGEVHRATSVHMAAGGKGLNVLRAARILGVPGIATGALAGSTGLQIAELAAREGIGADWFRLEQGESRNCLLINQPACDATVINEPGPAIRPREWEGFVRHCVGLANAVDGVAVSGSFLPGTPAGGAAALVSGLVGTGRRVLFDSSGAALQEVLGLPVLIKINDLELARALNQEPVRLELKSMIPQVRALLGGSDPARGIIVTRGSRSACWVGPQRAWLAEVPGSDSVVSSVGSGDAFLAAVCCGLLEGRTEPECLCRGVAAGSANVESPLPARFEVRRFRQLLGEIRATPVKE